MNILVADDNQFALKVLTDDLKTLKPNDNVVAFSLPREVLEYMDTVCDSVDIAFLDVEMPGMTGIELAVRIKTEISSYGNYIHYGISAICG